jgi:hypothetical protein
VTISEMSFRIFCLFAILLVGGAIIRSAIATRLDGFTIDEAYHIAAGVSYVRHADFRINPEHPPLVKLWVGSLLSATGFRLSYMRPFADKPDEREFTEQDVYVNNDSNSVQRRARIAMFVLNGLLLVLLSFAARRAFGPGVALATLLFLAIDPTVAAHLPVVMTDLPVALLSSAMLLLAIVAFQNWAPWNLAACSVALGLSLATKHSAPIFAVVLVLAGSVLAVVLPLSPRDNSRLIRFAKLFAVVGGALIVLWGSYFFRFAESGSGHEVFNRPLVDKIADLHSPAYRFVLSSMASTHVLPRAYIWGFADTVRAGLQGRFTPITAFGHYYWDTGPKYFFLAMIAFKLPIGLGVLALTGLLLFFTRSFSREWRLGLAFILGAAVLFLLVLASGSSYAGIRHALPVVVLLSIFAGIAVQMAFASNSKLSKVAVVTALVGAAVSAIPVMRPWEYFNELAGGTKNAHLYFNDEGVDLEQRGKELAEYYHRVLEPARDIPLIVYGKDVELKARDLDWLGHDKKRDETRLSTSNFSGTILINAKALNYSPFWDSPGLRRTLPTARFGNLFVFRGTFNCSGLFASNLYYEALSKIYDEKPALETAEQLLRQSISLDPSPFFVHIRLGNLCLKRGSREDALLAYSDALQYAPADSKLRRSIREQIKRVSVDPLDKIPELRSPQTE